MTTRKTKKELKQEFIDTEMELVKTEDYSVEEYNKTVDEIASLKDLDEGKELPFRVERFCQEYVTHYNEEKAAQRAGYPIWNAAAAGKRLLVDPKVQDRIQQLQKNITGKLKITRERLLEEYAKIGYFNIQDLYDDEGKIDLKNMNRDIAAAISGIKFGTKTVTDADGSQKVVSFIKEVSTNDKKAALDSLSKHLGLFDKDVDRQIPVDLKTFISMLPEEIQNQIKIGLAKRIGGSNGK